VIFWRAVRIRIHFRCIDRFTFCFVSLANFLHRDRNCLKKQENVMDQKNCSTIHIGFLVFSYHSSLYPNICPPIQYSCYNHERVYRSFLSLFYTLKYAIFADLPGGFAPWAPYQDFTLDPLGALGGSQNPRPNFVLPLQARYSYAPDDINPTYYNDKFGKI
jgi:hypothetical protein